jgi:hypothetical protein
LKKEFMPSGCIGHLVMFLCDRFVRFDWRHWQVDVSSGGQVVQILQKENGRAHQPVCVMVNGYNTTDNVTASHLRQSQTYFRDAFPHMHRHIDEALAGQEIQELMAKLDQPLPPRHVPKPQPQVLGSVVELLSCPSQVAESAAPPLPLPGPAWPSAWAAPGAPGTGVSPSSADHASFAAHGLKAGLTVFGKHTGVVVAPVDVDPGIDAASLPVILLVPGSGGFDWKTKAKHGKGHDGGLDLPFHCPRPCWYAYMNCDGNHKKQAPDDWFSFVRKLRQDSNVNRNTIIGWGFSRGGKWLIQLAREDAALLDVAVIFGGYPQTHDKRDQKQNALELIGIKTCILCLVHFLSDSVCGIMNFPTWHAELARFMAGNRNSESPLTSIMLEGTHEKDAYNMWQDWQIDKSPQFKHWFWSIWKAA